MEATHRYRPSTLPTTPQENPAEPLATSAAALTLAASKGNTSLSGAAPLLLGLLGLAIILLGLAALPPWTMRTSQFSALIATRRLEIGLVGTAVLASAAIGLLITIVAA